MHLSLLETSSLVMKKRNQGLSRLDSVSDLGVNTDSNPEVDRIFRSQASGPQDKGRATDPVGITAGDHTAA